ncbi:hypothetical protein [Accumulibacter sp.]|uniref:hypothetical protein n=1 Tax=Accumulibacter sp. TaxID=2053492 RepID=UPI002631ACA9|nr:hypothetical protein [Accumulibacter sp.]
MSKKARKWPIQSKARYLSAHEASVTGEVSYIQRLAFQRDARVVTLGSLVFFSTQSGDAWLLDTEDGLALKLAEDGDPLPNRIIETTERFMIEWNMTYQIDDTVFIYLDATGSRRVIVGYPIAEIRKAIERGQL